MFQKMMDLCLHVREGLLDRRRRHDTGNGDALVAVDVTVDAGEIDQDCRKAEYQDGCDEAEGEEELTADRQVAKPGPHGATVS